MIEKDTIVVFTARSPDRIIREGGSQAWVLNPARAKLCKWLVCTQNRHNPDHEFSDATEPHGEAYLIGKISAIAPSPEGHEHRWIIEISEFARISKQDVWKGWRNPVRYMSLSELGISIDDFEFQPVNVAKTEREVLAVRVSPSAMTIAEAKKGLAAAFGVKPDAIEITIRG